MADYDKLTEEYNKLKSQIEASIGSRGQQDTPPAIAPPAASNPAAMSNAVSVKAPNGQVYSFPNQKAANEFKAAAGIK